MPEIRVGIADSLSPHEECIQLKLNETCSLYAKLPYLSYVNGLIELILSDYMGNNVDLVRVSDVGYGQGFSLENSTGIVKGILDLKADVSPPDLDMTYDRSLVLSYGPALTFSPRVVVVNHRFAQDFYQLQYWTAFKMDCLLLWIAVLTFLWLMNRWFSQSHCSSFHRCIQFVSASSFLMFNALFNGRLIDTRSFTVSSLPFLTLENAATAIKRFDFRMVWPPGIGDAAQQEILTSPRFLKLRAALKQQPPNNANVLMIGKYIAENEKYFSYVDELYATSMVLSHKDQVMMLKDRKSLLVMQGYGYNRKNIKFGVKLVKASLAVIETGHLERLRRRTYARGTEQYYIDSENIESLSSRNDLPIKLSDLLNTFAAAFAVMVAIVGILIVEICAAWLAKL